MRIGVCALQGAVSEHIDAIEDAASRTGIACQAVPIRALADFMATDGLVLPGGESTTMSKLLRRFDLMEPLRRRINDEDYPVLATCAGMVLLAKEGDDQVAKTDTELIGTMDIAVDRNAFGRQRQSFEAEVLVNLVMPRAPMPPARSQSTAETRRAPSSKGVPAVFIRAPVVTRAWGAAETIATYQEHVVGVRQGRTLAFAFHPELTRDRRIHAAFLELVAGSMKLAPAQSV